MLDSREMFIVCHLCYIPWMFNLEQHFQFHTVVYTLLSVLLDNVVFIITLTLATISFVILIWTQLPLQGTTTWFLDQFIETEDRIIPDVDMIWAFILWQSTKNTNIKIRMVNYDRLDLADWT